MIALVIGLTVIIILGVILIIRNKTTLLARLNEKALNEKRLYNLVESSKDIIYYFEIKPGFRFRYLSPSIDTFFGEGHLKDCMKNPLIAFENTHPDDFPAVQKKIIGELDYTKPIFQRWKDADGNYLWFEEYATPIYKGDEIVGVQGIIRCVEEKIKLQQSLEHQIYHDSLTGIHNRFYFDKMMAELDRDNFSVGIILCDLDNLKQTNDVYGHKAGDELIKETANLLTSVCGKPIDVARIGGDEFVLIVPGIVESELSDITASIHHSIENYNASEPDHSIHLSLGYSYSATSKGRMEKLFMEADEKMYEMKSGRYCG